MLASGLVLALVLVPAASRGEDLYDRLNTLERESVDGALDELGLERVEEPEGSRFGDLIVVTLEVFLEDTSYLQWANIFHVTTRPHIVEDEVLWEPGQPFDTELVEETIRNLRESINFSVVAMVPVESDEPGVVDILAVTRDVWSLRLNSQLSSADGVIDELFIVASERNLAGRHKQLGLAFVYEQDTIQLGPRYFDPRLFRSRLQLFEELRFAINHDTGELEGTVNSLLFGLPLYSLDSWWGFEVSEAHEILIDRTFVGGDVRTYDDPDTADVERVPFEVDTREVEVRAAVLRGFGRTPRHIVSLGWGLSYGDHELLAQDVSDQTRSAFERDVLPRDEVASFALATWRFFAARWVSVRNHQTYAVAEDILIGPQMATTLRVAPEVFGSDNDHLRSSFSLAYTAVLPPDGTEATMRDGAVLTGDVTVGARWELPGGQVVDEFLTANAHLATPPLGPFKLHAGGSAELTFDRQTLSLLELGGSQGLRGYATGSFIGESLALGHIELRSAPIELLSVYFGFVGFADAGTIFDEGETGPFLSDVGIGLRLVAAQLQTIVYRFDYAFPTSGPSDPLPGVLTIGVDQVF